jgi:hypothetical protein
MTKVEDLERAVARCSRNTNVSIDRGQSAWLIKNELNKQKEKHGSAASALLGFDWSSLTDLSFSAGFYRINRIGFGFSFLYLREIPPKDHV